MNDCRNPEGSTDCDTCGRPSEPGSGWLLKADPVVVDVQNCDRFSGTPSTQRGLTMPPIMPEGRVLIVDDEPANVALLERSLQRHGYRHLTCTTEPSHALALFVKVRPDIVLLDLHMPNLDGFALMGQLSTVIGDDDFVPIIVLTADTTPDAMSRALSAGANDFLTKPFDITEVILRIGNLLTTRALHVRLQRQSRFLAEQLAQHETRQRQHAAEHDAQRRRIRRVLADDDSFHILYQPIVDLVTARIVGAEALARFTAEPLRGPELWFAEAAKVGLGVELEVAAVAAAMDRIHQLPPGAYMSINASPATVTSGALLPLLGTEMAPRIMLEVTEHVQIDDYRELSHALGQLRDRQVRVAIDDAGSGFASLQHILRLAPDVIKLDLALVRDINIDPVRRALASALVTFAADIGAMLVAEGIETQAELDVLTKLGVGLGQGYLLGRPQPLPLTDQHRPSRPSGNGTQGQRCDEASREPDPASAPGTARAR